MCSSDLTDRERLRINIPNQVSSLNKNDTCLHESHNNATPVVSSEGSTLIRQVRLKKGHIHLEEAVDRLVADGRLSLGLAHQVLEVLLKALGVS